MPLSAESIEIMKTATGVEDDEEEEKIVSDEEEGEEEEERVVGVESKRQKKKKREEIPITLIKPEDFDRHSKWKPEPFSDGENFATLYANIRAKHAEAAEVEMGMVLEKHVSAGLWPTQKVAVVCRQAQTLRAASVVAKADYAKSQTTSAESAAARADEKKKQIDALVGAMAVVAMGTLMKKDNLNKTMEERIALGLVEQTRVFTEWAPKINSWKTMARAKAIAAACDQGLETVTAEAILAKEAEDATKPSVDSPTAKGKRLAEEEEEEEAVADDTEELVTPNKPGSASASSSYAASPSARPPKQSLKHKQAKKPKTSSAATAAVNSDDEA